MKKILFSTLSMLILLITLTGCSTKETHTLGDYALLLDDTVSASEKSSFIKKNAINPYDFLVYQVEYTIINADSDNKDVKLPILSPAYLRTIKAVHSSIPLNKQVSKSELYGISPDAKWLKQNINDSNIKLTVKYLMDIRANSDFPDSLTLSELASKKLIDDSKINPKLKKALSLSNEIRNDLPVEQRDNLKSVANAYICWIKSHIAYPEKSYIDTYCGKYVNVADSELTLTAGIGVCEDYAIVLKDFLACQGIDSETVTGLSPTLNVELLTYHVSRHMVLGLPTKDGYYLLDATQPDTASTKPFKLPNGKVIRAYLYNTDKDNSAFYSVIFPTLFSNTSLKPSELRFRMYSVKASDY